jgi:hypothetical protein
VILLPFKTLLIRHLYQTRKQEHPVGLTRLL